MSSTEMDIGFLVGYFEWLSGHMPELEGSLSIRNRSEAEKDWLFSRFKEESHVFKNEKEYRIWVQIGRWKLLLT
jgi:hypothetical protein